MTRFYVEYTNNISLIENHDTITQLQIHLQFTYMISCMERYLFTAMMETMDANPVCYENIAKETKISAKLSTIYTKGLDRFIKENLLVDFQYHNIYQVKIYYKNAFDILFPSNLKEISEAIGKRHDIVHRCGFSKKEKRVDITVEDMKKLQENVTHLILNIDEQLEKKFYSSSQQ